MFQLWMFVPRMHFVERNLLLHSIVYSFRIYSRIQKMSASYNNSKRSKLMQIQRNNFRAVLWVFQDHRPSVLSCNSVAVVWVGHFHAITQELLIIFLGISSQKLASAYHIKSYCLLLCSFLVMFRDWSLRISEQCEHNVHYSCLKLEHVLW